MTIIDYHDDADADDADENSHPGVIIVEIKRHLRWM